MTENAALNPVLSLGWLFAYYAYYLTQEDKGIKTMEQKLAAWAAILGGLATAGAYFAQWAREIMGNPWTMGLYFVMTWGVMYLAGYLLYKRLHRRLKEETKPKTLDIVIPVSGWSKDETDTTGYPWFIEIPNKAITANMITFVTLSKEEQVAARAVGFSSVAETVNGAVRLFSSNTPKQPLTASLTLIDSALM